MLPDRIERAGAGAFLRWVTPLGKLVPKEGTIASFDTEYDSRTGELVAFQLWTARGGNLYVPPLTVPRLFRELDALLEKDGGAGREVYLFSFFSVADVRFLPVFQDAARFFTAAKGSLDVDFKHGDRLLRVQDLARWWDGASLAEAAATLGLKKHSFDRTRVSRASLGDLFFRRYALEDARIAYLLATKLRAAFLRRKADILATPTPAGCAAAIFRRQYLRKPLRPPAQRVRRLSLDCVWGGRAEVFARGPVERLREYDFRAAYPQAAVDLEEFPLGRSWYPVTCMKDVGYSRGGVARAAFIFPQGTPYPCLPVCTEEGQYYPLEGVTLSTFAELVAAEAMGARIALQEAYGYTHGTQDFSRYLDDLLEERKGTKGAQRLALKLLANCTIGKTAQLIEDVSLEDLRRVSKREGIPLMDLAAMAPPERESFGVRRKILLGALFFPEWNALVTGLVRARLAPLLAKYRGAYCHTDSLWTAETIPAGVCRRERLALVREGPATIARTRLAAIWSDPPHVAHHSIATEEAAIALLEDFDAQARAEGRPRYLSHTYTYERPVFALESLRYQLPFGRWIRRKQRCSTKWDSKRRLLPDGRGTAPWGSVDEREHALR